VDHATAVVTAWRQRGAE